MCEAAAAVACLALHHWVPVLASEQAPAVLLHCAGHHLTVQALRGSEGLGGVAAAAAAAESFLWMAGPRVQH